MWSGCKQIKCNIVTMWQLILLLYNIATWATWKQIKCRFNKKCAIRLLYHINIYNNVHLSTSFVFIYTSLNLRGNEKLFLILFVILRYAQTSSKSFTPNIFPIFYIIFFSFLSCSISSVIYILSKYCRISFSHKSEKTLQRNFLKNWFFRNWKKDHVSRW